ncbi:MAG: cytochrome C [Nitrospirae bacterium]|nr:cytochrome C [Nitrospirota bacterium]
METKKKALLLTTVFFLLAMIIYACASQPVAPEAAQPQLAPQQQEATAQPEPAKAEPVSPYAMEIKPLSTSECGRCHYSVFSQIKNEGGKHQLDCTQCHEKFHAYNPIKQNWKEIMPKCEGCHGLIHGEKFAACAQCHSNPHAPKTQMAMSAEFTKTCGDCHAQVGQELQKNISKHTKVACAVCHHSKHGLIPSCMQCHKPHTPEQVDKDCLSCHPAHSPLIIAYPQTTPNNVCGACHAPVYKKLEGSASKHRQVACAQCHSKHRYIPKCEECHGKPHGEVVLKKFPNCLQCHVDVHDLPSKSAAK